MPTPLQLLLLLLLATAFCTCDIVEPLHSLPWRLDNLAGFGNVTVENTSLPVSVHEVLQAAGIVGDPLWR